VGTEMEMYAEMHLVFENDFNVNDITRKIGVIPTECKNSYETRVSPITKKQCEGYWTLKSKVFNKGDLKVVLGDLISLIADKLPVIKDICDTNGGEVVFDIVPSFCNDDTPAIYFDRDFLDIVHYLNATIQIDMLIN
jgi:hypothetical protein